MTKEKQCLICGYYGEIKGNYCNACEPYAKRAIKITKKAQTKTLQEFFDLCKEEEIGVCN